MQISYAAHDTMFNFKIGNDTLNSAEVFDGSKVRS